MKRRPAARSASVKKKTRPRRAPGRGELARFPIVGLGASAGGLAAFEAFFSGMPPGVEPGMAFVLVQHLAPDHESILADLVQRYTRMKVFEVRDGMVVRPNCAYIIPPNRDLALAKGVLHLLEPSAPRGQRLAIDFFFRSLAQDQRDRAIAVVLSGTGSDGAQGIKEVHAEGGLVLAQSLESAESDGMPRSAIATGVVDLVLPPEEMGARLIALSLGAAEKPSKAALAPPSASALKRLFVLLQAHTGHDFSQYKLGTIQRRIERRMAVHRLASIDDYLRYAQQTPAEVVALFRDLLISVTSFFRDPEAFEALQRRVLPGLLASKAAGAPLRVWSVGCSTGEEAYSLAILLAEYQESVKQSFPVKIFGTDIDGQAIATARTGLYPASIAAEVSPERLARYFLREPGGTGYRLHRSIREQLVFSEQDAIKDPPFSRLDLICCRNLLIYFDGALQKKLLPLFHYALNPGGVLLLGTSESVGELVDLFAPLDRKQKLYRRRDSVPDARRPPFGRVTPPPTEDQSPTLRVPEKVGPSTRPLRQLTEATLLEQVNLAGVLVDARGDILYVHGRTGQYLEPTPGAARTGNVLRMAREGLREGLTTALKRAAAGQAVVRLPGLRVKTNGSFSRVALTVRPTAVLQDAPPEAPLYLVILEETPAQGPRRPEREAAAAPRVAPKAEARIQALTEALRVKEAYLQATIEQQETTNEELKSSNEEMQSVNEELQSTNEELETSKEELQSLNEELATVNSELQAKVSELSVTNNDMVNLLAGTGIGTIFVDHQLNILRFTPAATQVMNFIATDVGRPVGHIVSKLRGYDTLAEDVKAVLDSLIPKEIEVQAKTGGWFLLRIRPYRTLENVVEGAVLAFLDITELTRLRQEHAPAAAVPAGNEPPAGGASGAKHGP
jgi:two-component system, chemotaxis family, CheB/CheR fusion protein